MGWFSRRKNEAAAPATANPADLVVPMLSGQAWMDANTEMFAKIPDFPPGQHPYARTLCPDVYVTYATDPGPSWQVVTLDDAPSYGEPDQLHARALHNLAQRGNISVDGAGGRFKLTVTAELDLSASVLLAPGRWRPTLDVVGDLAIAIPTRVDVLLCSVDDADSIAALRTHAASLYEQAAAKPVTPRLLRMDGGGSLSVLD